MVILDLLVPYLKALRGKKYFSTVMTQALLSIDYDSSSAQVCVQTLEQIRGCTPLDENVLMHVARAGDGLSRLHLLRAGSLWNRFPIRVFHSVYPRVFKQFRNRRSELLADILRAFLAETPKNEIAKQAEKFRKEIRLLLRSKDAATRSLASESVACLRYPSLADLKIMLREACSSYDRGRICALNAFGLLFYLNRTLPKHLLDFFKKSKFEKALLRISKKDRLYRTAAKSTLERYARFLRQNPKRTTE